MAGYSWHVAGYSWHVAWIGLIGHNVRDEQEVLWAVATRFQADRDLMVLSGLPGSLLDPSSAGGITARMGLDATRKPGFDAVRVSLSEDALGRARAVLGSPEG